MSKVLITKRSLASIIKEETGLSSYDSLEAANHLLSERSLANFLFDKLGETTTNVFKRSAINLVASVMGIKQDSIFYQGIREFIIAYDIRDLQADFENWQEGGCEKFSSGLLEAIFKTVIFKSADLIVKQATDFSNVFEPSGRAPAVEGIIQGLINDTASPNFKNTLTVGVIEFMKEFIAEQLLKPELQLRFSEAMCDLSQDFDFGNFADATGDAFKDVFSLDAQ